MHFNGIVAFGVVATFGVLAHTAPVPLPSIELSGGNYARRPRSSTRTPSYQRWEQGCVNGNNMAYHAGQTVAECAALCDADSSCVAFEYGVDYGGGGGYKAQDCSLQSSANRAGCDGGYWDTDLYVKHMWAPPVYTSDGAGKTYDTMASMCTSRGSSLCSVDQVCPDGGAYTAPIGGGQDFDDMWLPVVDTDQPANNKQWVQVGRRAGGTCKRLTDFHPANTAGSWMETTQNLPWKQVYACCDDDDDKYSADELAAMAQDLEAFCSPGSPGSTNLLMCPLLSYSDWLLSQPPTPPPVSCATLLLEKPTPVCKGAEKLGREATCEETGDTITFCGGYCYVPNPNFGYSMGCSYIRKAPTTYVLPAHPHNNGADGQTSNNQRSDSTSWKYKGKKAKDCSWVASAPTAAKRRKRCLLKNSNGKRAVNECQAACAPQ